MAVLLVVLLIILRLVEIWYSSRWSPQYFENGIPILHREYQVLHPDKFSLCRHWLQWNFQGGSLPALEFHLLTPYTCAFRESKFFYNEGDDRDTEPVRFPGITFTYMERYTPFMRGILRLEPLSRTLTLTGYLNWYALFFTALWWILAAAHKFNTLAIAFALSAPALTIFTLGRQVHRYTEVGDFAAKSLSEGNLLVVHP